MRALVIKNVRDHPVKVGEVTLNPGQQLGAPNGRTAEIDEAERRGDISVGGAATPEELRADAEALAEGAEELRKTAEE